MGHIQIWQRIFSCQKTLKYFNDIQNRNFSVLRLVNPKNGNETKSDQTFFHGTYSNLTTYLYLSKNIKVFQRLSKSKLLSFMTKVNTNNENETKSDIFPWDIHKSGIVFYWS